ncbi:hypothetical protein DRQ09_03315 [candidate division KSB1 bacterium]|nr:MAG: hypothetical protein DRQ09_03315 [candidate division KSB1 bacterium]
MKYFKILCVTIFLLLIISSINYAQTQRWSTATSMNYPRDRLSVASAGGYIYAIGGRNSTSDSLNYVEKFDGSSWTDITGTYPLPMGVSGAATAVLNDTIYIIGGKTAGGIDTNTVQVFSGNSWETRTPMNSSREGASAVVYNGKIYVFGGYHSGTPTNTCEVYDPVTGTWTTQSSTIPNSIAYATAQLANNDTIYIFGGEDNIGATNTTYAYDPNTDQWTTKSNIVNNLTSLVSIKDSYGYIYLIGGMDENSNIQGNLNIYQYWEDNWMGGDQIIEPRAGTGVDTLNNLVYIIGGKGQDGNFKNTVVAFNPEVPTSPGIGVEFINENYVKINFGLWEHDIDYIIVYRSETMGFIPAPSDSIGIVKWSQGECSFSDSSINSFTPYYYRATSVDSQKNKSDFSSEKGIISYPDPYITLNPLSTARMNHTSAPIFTSQGDSIFIIGGFDGTNSLSSVEKYSKDNNVLISGTNLPSSIQNAAIATYNNNIYLFGGYDGTSVVNSVLMFDSEQDTWVSKTSFTNARQYASACEFNGKIYLIGGKDGSSTYVKTVEIYDPVTDTWTTATNQSPELSCFALVRSESKIYALGGFNFDNNPENNIYEYNPDTDEWQNIGGLSINVGGHVAAYNDNRIYVFGGRRSSDSNDYSSSVQLYDIEKNYSYETNTLPTGRYFLSAATSGYEIFLSGGTQDGTNPMNTFEIFKIPLVTVRVSMPTDLRALPGDTIIVPIDIKTELGGQVLSIQGKIHIDTTKIRCVKVDSNDTDFTNGFTASVNTAQPDTIKFSLASSQPFTGTGKLLTMKMVLDSSIAAEENIILEFTNFELNEGPPWADTSNGKIVVKALTGDVSLNNEINAYDASLVLQHTVNIIFLTGFGEIAADVTGNGTISAYDAALILQFSAGIINTFPVDQQSLPKIIPAIESPIIAKTEHLDNLTVISLYSNGKSNIFSLYFKLNYGPNIKFSKVKETDLSRNYITAVNSKGNSLIFAMAGSKPVSKKGKILELCFINSSNSEKVNFKFSDFTINESKTKLEFLSDKTPLKFDLMQNYPNPFNPETIISYQLKNDTRVLISIYNILGQEVKTLIKDFKKAGFHKVKWDGRDNNNNRVASGVYIVKLKAGNFIKSKKILLIK